MFIHYLLKKGGAIMRRNKLRKKTSKKMFSRSAMKVNSKNARGRPMRGGYRL